MSQRLLTSVALSAGSVFWDARSQSSDYCLNCGAFVSPNLSIVPPNPTAQR